MDTLATACALPTHATPSSANNKTALADGGLHERRRLRRRRCFICLGATIGVLLLVAITLVVLFLTVLRVRDPTTSIVSARLIGFSSTAAATPPTNNLTTTAPAPPLDFNITVLLTVAVHNPNRASFAFESGGHAQLWYRGVLVGDAEIEPGSVPSRGDGTLQMVMNVLSESFTLETLAQLMKDIEAGAVPLDSSARIPGKAVILKVIKLRAVAYSDCHVVFGFPEMQIRSQECHDHTKL